MATFWHKLSKPHVRAHTHTQSTCKERRHFLHTNQSDWAIKDTFHSGAINFIWSEQEPHTVTSAGRAETNLYSAHTGFSISIWKMVGKWNKLLVSICILRQDLQWGLKPSPALLNNFCNWLAQTIWHPHKPIDNRSSKDSMPNLLSDPTRLSSLGLWGTWYTIPIFQT